MRRFLQRRFGKRAVVISALQPADIRQFLAEELDKRGTYSNAATLASSLRAYFRYRGTQGDRVHHLTGVIASPATHIYVEADLAMKDRALGRLQEPAEKVLRYRAPEALMQFLKTL